MPRFFFDIVGGKGETTDTTGQDFPDAKAAFDAAMRVLSEVAGEIELDSYSARYSCTVRDSAGLKVFRSTISIVGEPLTLGHEINNGQNYAHEGESKPAS